MNASEVYDPRHQQFTNAENGSVEECVQAVMGQLTSIHAPYRTLQAIATVIRHGRSIDPQMLPLGSKNYLKDDQIALIVCQIAYDALGDTYRSGQLVERDKARVMKVLSNYNF